MNRKPFRRFFDTLPRFRLDSVQREDVLYTEVGFSATPTTTGFFGVASPQQNIIEQRDDESSSAGGATTAASTTRGRGEEVVGREPFGGRVSCCCCCANRNPLTKEHVRERKISGKTQFPHFSLSARAKLYITRARKRTKWARIVRRIPTRTRTLILAITRRCC